jgi:hypothetical protein
MFFRAVPPRILSYCQTDQRILSRLETSEPGRIEICFLCNLRNLRQALTRAKILLYLTFSNTLINSLLFTQRFVIFIRINIKTGN